MAEKLNYEFVKNYIENYNFILLSIKYNNSKEKLKIKCPKGHEFKMNWDHFKRGQRCSKCSGIKKLTYEFVKNKFNIEGYKLLSKTYKNNFTKLDVLCPNNHKIKLCYHDFDSGNRCQLCYGNKRYTHEEVKNIFKKYGYKLLSKKYGNNKSILSLKCPKGHKIKMKLNHFLNSERCGICYKENNRGENHHSYKNYTKEELKEFKNYRMRVMQLSNQIFNKYYYQINPNKLKRGYNDYHLDHIYTVLDGFENNISSEVISNPNNLQMMWWNDNIVKSSNSEITKQLLYHIAT